MTKILEYVGQIIKLYKYLNRNPSNFILKIVCKCKSIQCIFRRLSVTFLQVYGQLDTICINCYLV